LGIGMVFQELSLAPQLSVVDNLFLGREQRTTWWRVDFASQRKQCRTVLAEVGLDIDGNRSVHTLSMAQKQLLEIAKALLRQPRVLILDEPTASLAEAEIVPLFKLIEKLKKAEIAILYVTHHMREVLRVCDQISLIRDGRIVATQPVTSDMTEQQLVFLLTGGRSRSHQRERHRTPSEDPLLSVEGVETPTCASLSMQVFAGEVVGIYGVMGCGREELLRVLIGFGAAFARTHRSAWHPLQAPHPTRCAFERGGLSMR
jgi:ribose transport system ATP-binding protein